jgi:hypothetical protein
VVRAAAGSAGKGQKRRTTYDEIEQIKAAEVVSANQLYVNREEGFIGLNWRTPRIPHGVPPSSMMSSVYGGRHDEGRPGGRRKSSWAGKFSTWPWCRRKAMEPSTP